MERLIICTVGLFFGLVTALVVGIEVYKAFTELNVTLVQAIQGVKK